MQQVAVRGVHLDEPEAGGERAPRRGAERLDHRRDARLVERARHARTPSRTARSPGATGVQPPVAPAGPRRRPPTAARCAALRPACASWMPGTAPCSSTNARDARQRRDLRRRARARGRPRRDAALGRTAVASAMTAPGAAGRAAAEVHQVPVVRRCRPRPSTGTWATTTMRLRSVTERRVSGSKSVAASASTWVLTISCPPWRARCSARIRPRRGSTPPAR